MKKLDPKSVWLFFIQYSIGCFFFVFFFGGCFLFPFLMSALEFSASNIVGSAFLIMLVSLMAFLFLVVVGSYIFARLSYDNYLYELKDDGFYKESGVITKKYVTIPYERIQNVDIHRGIIARILGLSDLQIQTAGMSATYYGRGTYGVAAEGRLPGVSENDAKEIRDELIKRAKGSKGGV